MINITTTTKGDTTTTIVTEDVSADLDWPFDDLNPISVYVTKKKVKTEEGVYESVTVTTNPEDTTFDTTLKLLKVLEAVG